MYENPFDRKFGIEFEFACPNMGRVGSNPRRLSRGDLFRSILEENGLSDWRVGADGSEWEVKSGILSGPTGFKKVKRFLDLVVNQYNAYVSLTADGLHVHHDAPEFYHEDDSYPPDPYYGRQRKMNREPVTRLVENWYAMQPEIYKMVNICRVDRYACPAWRSEDVIRLRNNFDVECGRFGRKNLNISALNRHGTIELRLHEGTLDYDEIFSWVRFGQAFIGKAVEETNAYVQASSAFDLMREVKVSRNAMRFLSRKIEGNHAVNNANYRVRPV